jgi:hypothetical protein
MGLLPISRISAARRGGNKTGELAKQRPSGLRAARASARLLKRNNAMTSTTRMGLAALVLATTLSVSSTSALAIGCIAVSEEGSYGYSYNYDDEGDAREKALNECAARTTEDAVCEITECDEDS